MGILIVRGLVIWLPPQQSVSQSNQDRTPVTETCSLVTWYEKEGVNKCMHKVHATCIAGPHSVTGNEVA